MRSVPMQEKTKKRLKLLLTILVIVAFTGYFAFRTFVFDPLEGSVGRMDVLVPQNVDFFLRKQKLAEDFSEFPKPKFYEALSFSESWDRFLKSQAYTDLESRYQFSAQLQEFENTFNQLHLDPLDDCLGEDVLVAGRFQGRSFVNADLLLLTKVSWKIKLGLGLLNYESLRKQFGVQGKWEEMPGDVMQISELGPRPIFLWRYKDVLAITTNQNFLQDAQLLLEKRGEDSFGLSAKYEDEILHVAQKLEGESFEVFINLQPFANNFFGLNHWPVPHWELTGRILAKFIKPSALLETLCVINLEQGVQGRAHFVLNRDNLEEFQTRFYGTRALDRVQDILEAAKLAPKKSFSLGAIAGDIQELGYALEEALSVSQKKLINDQFRASNQFKDTRHFIEHFASAFWGKIYIMFRRNDYPTLENDPPNDGAPDPLWAAVFLVRDSAKVQELVDYFKEYRSSFSVQSIYEFDARGGYKAVEFWSELIPTTGEIAVLPAGDQFYISNSPKYLRDIIQCRFGEDANISLFHQENFRSGIEAMESSANVFFYLDTREYQKVLAEQIPLFAQTMFLQDFDYRAERQRARQRILNERMPQLRGKALNREETAELERMIDEEVRKMEAERRGPLIRDFEQELNNYGLWLSNFPHVWIGLKSDPKWLELELRATVDWR